MEKLDIKLPQFSERSVISHKALLNYHREFHWILSCLLIILPIQLIVLIMLLPGEHVKDAGWIC